MKKYIIVLPIALLFSFGLMPKALADSGDVCAIGMSVAAITADPSKNCCKAPQILEDGGGCPVGTLWIGARNAGSCLAPVSCPTLTFSCATNSCIPLTVLPPPSPTCSNIPNKSISDPSVIHIGNSVCKLRVSVFQETASLYKLWLNGILQRLVTVPDVDCVDGQTPVWNNTAKAWACGQGDSLWLATSNNISNTNTGNVGIGTGNPATLLQLVDNTNLPFGMLSLYPMTPTQGLEFSYNSIYKVGTDANSSLSIDAKGTGSLILNSSYANSKTGIGTNTPQNKLDVKGAMVVGSWYGGTATAGGTAADKGLIVEGGVGIGNNSPVNKLLVSDLSNTGLRVVNQTAGGTVASFGDKGAFQIDATAIPGGRFTVLENGNVGIGIANPGAKLEVNGQVKITGGTPGAGKVLTSDASGLASWQAASGGGSTFYTNNNMYYTAPQAVTGYVTPSPAKTLSLSGLTVGADGMAVTGISGITNYGGGSPTSMVVRLYSGTHSTSFIVAIPGGSTNQPFYIPLTIPAKFGSSLSVDLTATYAFASIQVYDFSLEYVPLPL